MFMFECGFEPVKKYYYFQQFSCSLPFIHKLPFSFFLRTYSFSFCGVLCHQNKYMYMFCDCSFPSVCECSTDCSCSIVSICCSACIQLFLCHLNCMFQLPCSMNIDIIIIIIFILFVPFVLNFWVFFIFTKFPFQYQNLLSYFKAISNTNRSKFFLFIWQMYCMISFFCLDVYEIILILLIFCQFSSGYC